MMGRKYADSKHIFGSQAYCKLYHRIAWVIFLSMLFYLVGRFSASEFLYQLTVTCKRSFYERAKNPDSLGTGWISPFVRNFLFFWVVRGCYVGLLIMTLIFATTNGGERSYLFSSSSSSPSGGGSSSSDSGRIITLPRGKIVVAYVGCFFLYFPGVWFAEFLKSQTSDYECNPKKPNGVSGHAFYITWAFFTLLYFADVLYYAHCTARMHKLQITMTLVVFFCLAQQAFFTFLYGYHSLGQLYIGSIIGSTYTLCTCAFADYVIFGSPTRRFSTDKTGDVKTECTGPNRKS
eukprot:Nk52_evm3s268 gene=Nk52_evmTU3s268